MHNSYSVFLFLLFNHYIFLIVIYNNRYHKFTAVSDAHGLSYTLGARGSSTLVGGIMKDTRGFKRSGGEREEPLEHFYGFYCFNCHMSIKR
jgi:hypothetical protein